MFSAIERLIELDQEDAVKRRERTELMLLMKAVLEALPDGLVATDLEGNVILFNEKAEYMFGHHRSEVIGQKVEMLLPERIRDTHVKRRQFYNRSDIGAHSRTMGLGQQLTGLCSDGSEFPADITVSRMVAPRGVINLALIRYSPRLINHFATDAAPANPTSEPMSRDTDESNGGK